MSFRFATEEDCALLLWFIRQLASYEKMADQVIATEELLREWIFEKRKAEVIFALENGKEVGFALFFHNFSTFLGRAGIYGYEFANAAELVRDYEGWSREDFQKRFDEIFRFFLFSSLACLRSLRKA